MYDKTPHTENLTLTDSILVGLTAGDGTEDNSTIRDRA